MHAQLNTMKSYGTTADSVNQIIVATSSKADFGL